MWVREGPQRLPAHRSVYVSLYWFVINDWGDGLLSFNYKLAVLVSEADVQIKKVRHARLILVNLPLHISPACQLLCDSNHHRHMPLLCVPPPLPNLCCTAVVVYFPGLTFMCRSVVIVKIIFPKKKKS